MDRLVSIGLDGRFLQGQLRVPEEAQGVVLFAHGSGSGRDSPRNQFVADELHRAGLATLLLDLLSEDETQDRAKVFDIELLASRLTAAARWLRCQSETASLPLGHFGASTGAAAALVATAQAPGTVDALVSRGGRPDLAGGNLAHVLAPTLLIVGSKDELVLRLNEQALASLPCARELHVIPRATHLFSESGALEEVARLAARWFLRHLPGSPTAAHETERVSLTRGECRE
jgi:putative phosphoribosyl transferase